MDKKLQSLTVYLMFSVCRYLKSESKILTLSSIEIQCIKADILE